MSERPERKKQAEMIVDLLRRKPQASGPSHSKKIKKNRKRVSRPAVSSPRSEESFRLAQDDSGRMVKVRFRVLEPPPKASPDTNSESIWSMVEGALKAHNSRKVISENFYSKMSKDPASNSIFLTNNDNSEDQFELCRGISGKNNSASKPTLERGFLEALKTRFKIGYLF